MTFLVDVLGYLYKKQQEGGRKHPPKSHIARLLGGHRLDEQSGDHRKKSKEILNPGGDLKFLIFDFETLG